VPCKNLHTFAIDTSIAAVTHLRTLLSLVLTNSEARKLLSDFQLIGRDLLAKGASKAAANIAPPQDRLQQVDQSAPADRFHTEGGRTIGPDEGTPVLEARIPGTDTTIAQHPKDPIGSIPTNAAEAAQAVRDPHGTVGHNATVRTGDGREMKGEDAMYEGRDRAQQQGERVRDQARSEADDVNRYVLVAPSPCDTR
jgi:hypothetical protein